VNTTGINGAGKTTAMGMLTAEFPPTEGDATLGGFSVKNEPEKTRRRIGYCPQFDAHFQNMTGREHVQLYAAIKGVPKADVEAAVNAKLAEVGLSEYDSDRLSQGYSGGMKRKLSVACATIGQPQIVFLDEPSTGMDPVARRDMWAVISEMVSGGNMPDEDRTSVILTTHAMEECEALCPRIGIMANGRLRCIGSAQHLKDRFGQGYQVEAKVEFVEQTDEDYLQIVRTLAEVSGKIVNLDNGEEEMGPIYGGAQDVFFNVDEAVAALSELDPSIAALVDGVDPVGYAIYKNASSPAGCTLQELATFAATETRMNAVEKFFADNFEEYTLRERQDTKARYEVSSKGVRISSIFGKIEENKTLLNLADYGVSQTSLEQVFNMHAAVAEKLKHEALKDGVTDG
jgi:ATP-binding cassette subfamily A (ABC1) protein 3